MPAKVPASTAASSTPCNAAADDSGSDSTGNAGSSLLLGVADDAPIVARAIIERHGSAARPA